MNSAGRLVLMLSGVALTVCGVANPGAASMPGPVSLGTLVEKSDLVVKVTVLETSSEWIEDERGRHIYTTVTARTDTAVKGVPDANVFQLQVVGGTVGDITEAVSDSPTFSQGEEAVLFLSTDPLRLSQPGSSVFQVRDGKVYLDTQQITLETFLNLLETLVEDPSAAVVFPELPLGAVPAEARRPSGAPRVTNPDAAKETRSDSAEAGPLPLSWQTIFCETFEGSFPDTNWDIYGDPSWDDTSYSSHGGLWSGWCADTSRNPVDGYADNMNAWMVYGPFSLVGATNARVDFWFRNKSEQGFDYFQWFASVDGNSFNGYQISGDQDSWQTTSFDLTNVPTLGNLCGQSQVWIGFRFVSDPSISGPTYTGAYVDDICIYKDIGADPPTIANISPGIGSAGTATEVAITGSNFRSTQGTSAVELFYRSGQPKIEAPVVSWSDTQIRCTVPVDIINGYPASAGSGPATVTTDGGTSNGYTFRVTFGYGGLRWGTSGAQTVPYRTNESCADCTGEGAEVIAAAESWNGAGSAFLLSYDGTHTNTTASGNSVNEIMWGSTGGSLATTTYWYSGSRILECDVVFNDDYVWSTTGAAGTYDIQSVAVHEFGHWLNLRDLYGDVGDGEYDTAKVMYGYGSAGTTKRSLHVDDWAGILYIYGYGLAALCGDVYDYGGGGPLTAAGSPYTLTCDVTVPSGQALTAEPGTTLVFENGWKLTALPGSSGFVASGSATDPVRFERSFSTRLKVFGSPGLKATNGGTIKVPE